MENSKYTDEQVDEYIMGLLDKDQKSLFEKDLASNTALALHMKEREELILGIEEYHSQEFKNKLKKIHSKNFNASSVSIAKKRNLRPWIAIAATIAFLVVAMWWMNNASYTSAELYASNFQPHELSLTQRGEEEVELLRLEELYKSKKYEEAIPLFEAMKKEASPSAQLLLGSGISRLASNQTKEALVDFQAILKSGDLLYKDHARWYTALGYLQMDNQKEAKIFLNLLANDVTADHHEEAVSLLDKMN